MTSNEIRKRYFKWLCNLIDDKSFDIKRYSKLLDYLHDTTFTVSMARDENRAIDGIDLRYSFGRIKRISDNDIAIKLDTDPCSVLEMMVALAYICEERIMDDPEYGNRRPFWFWEMIKSLRLYSMTDDVFSQSIFEEKVSIFLERQYSHTGAGGLFTILNIREDMRDVEIWYQMCWYLNNLR